MIIERTSSKTVILITAIIGVLLLLPRISTAIITLSDFHAVFGDGQVTLLWKTETELNNAGFNIYRSETEIGGYAQINDSLIPADGFSQQGASYEFVDTEIQNGMTYYYQLEDLDLGGTPTMHGPVIAKACTDNACNDGFYCNGVETCQAGSCVNGQSPCTQGQTCNEATHECINISTSTTTTTTSIVDTDGDGIPDAQDNCPLKPNGSLLGTCMPGSDKVGTTCMSDADCVIGCSSNGNCSKNQEDTDSNGIGDVCDLELVQNNRITTLESKIIQLEQALKNCGCM